MSAALAPPAAIPLPSRRRGGGTPARRAVARWAWRMFQREWKRQLLILASLAVAVAATVVGLGVITNVSVLHDDPVFGAADTDIQLSGSSALIREQTAFIERHFHPVDVIDQQSVSVPGSVQPLGVLAENPHGTYVHPIIRLDSGRYPVGPDQVAMTSGVASLLSLKIGDHWSAMGRSYALVGIVENPLDLTDQFALVAPGELPAPSSAQLLLNGGSAVGNLQVPGSQGLAISQRGTGGQAQAAAVVLAMGVIALLFVGLLAVAGFAVLAHRRLRSLGMLSSLGATDRHVRQAMVANGAVVGATAALVGGVAGFLIWLGVAPALQTGVERRIDRFDLPWWAVIAALILAFVTSVLAAWWPARSIARMPVVVALSGRPPRPQPARRFAGAGIVTLAVGIVLLAFTHERRAGFVVSGCILTVVGLVLFAPLAIQGLARIARRLPFVTRLAIRDLARFQARSGAALGAATLAVAIAATIVIAAAANVQAASVPNLSSDQILFQFAGADQAGSPLPQLTTAEEATAQRSVGAFAAKIGARKPLQLDEAINPAAALVQGQDQVGSTGGTGPQPVSLATVKNLPDGQAFNLVATLYVATPAVLARYGISAGDVQSSVDVLSSYRGRTDEQILVPLARRSGSAPAAPAGGVRHTVAGRHRPTHPTFQTTSRLSKDTSDPTTLITESAMNALGLEAVPAAWLVQSSHPLTAAQIASATKLAGALGLTAETKTAAASYSGLKDWSTAAGLLLALGVLAMTVGLIRSESGSDLRTLTAAGASSIDRRNLTGATSGSLGLLAGLLGVAGAYAALLAWYRSDLHPLTNIPLAELLSLVLGLPVVAFAAGWLLAGREPAGVGRQPIE